MAIRLAEEQIGLADAAECDRADQQVIETITIKITNAVNRIAIPVSRSVSTANGFSLASNDDKPLRTIAAVTRKQVTKVEPRRKRSLTAASENHITLAVKVCIRELILGPAKNDVVKIVAVEIRNNADTLKRSIDELRWRAFRHRRNNREPLLRRGIQQLIQGRLGRHVPAGPAVNHIADTPQPVRCILTFTEQSEISQTIAVDIAGTDILAEEFKGLGAAQHKAGLSGAAKFREQIRVICKTAPTSGVP